MADSHLNKPVPAPRPSAQVASSSNTPDGNIFPTASRAAATYNSDEIFNPGARGVRLFVVNDGAGGSTATAKIQVRDPYTDTWIDLPGATTAALGATTGSILTVYPGVTGIADAGGNVNQHLGPAWRVTLTIAVATGSSSVSADYLL